MPYEPGSGWAEEKVRRVKVNFTFENVKGQDEVNSEASAFQREEVELAKLFLIWPCCKVLDPLQLVYIGHQCIL